MFHPGGGTQRAPEKGAFALTGAIALVAPALSAGKINNELSKAQFSCDIAVRSDTKPNRGESPP